MTKKEKRFLEGKLSELLNNNIISNEQYNTAKNYFSDKSQGKSSSVTIFLSIGILLIALSLITLFAINWNNIAEPIKIVISFLPLVITSIMLHKSIYNGDKKIKLYTGIFAPISILATNSLVSQVFHIQTEIYELIFTSLLMFLPVAFVLRNSISVIVYGVGAISYSLAAADNYFYELALKFNAVTISLPLIIFNMINYIRNKNDRKNIIMWTINICLVTVLAVRFEVLRADCFILYFYMLYFVTRYLFGSETFINKLFSFVITSFIVISCANSYILSFVEDIDLGLDTLVLTLLTGLFFFLSKAYRDTNEYFTSVFVFLIQLSKLNREILLVLCNIIVVLRGIYKIITGNKLKLNNQTKQGVGLILLIILFRFISSDLSFMKKSILFLITGIGFMAGADIMKKKMGEDDDK